MIEIDVQTNERLERRLIGSVFSGDDVACGILTEMERRTRARGRQSREKKQHGRQDEEKEMGARHRPMPPERDENVVANKKCA